jgi:hypothetical protein
VWNSAIAIRFCDWMDVKERNELSGWDGLVQLALCAKIATRSLVCGN